MHRTRQRRAERRGAVLIEFALVAVVFFTVVFAVIEFGRAVMVENLLYAAAREGARTGVPQGATSSQVQTAVQNYLTNGGITASAATISVNLDYQITTPNAGPVNTVSVSVSIPYSSISWVPNSWFFGSSATMSANCVLLCETYQ